MSVDTRTGEIVPVDPSNEASVVTLLERAATWLAEAVHRGEPGEVAAVKAQLATAAEATKQLGLSKEIQLDAKEMVRRAEYALGKAIRRGQAEGTVAKRGTGLLPGGRPVDVDHPDTEPAPRSVTDFAPRGELYGSARATGVLDMADAEQDDFDSAIDEAKAEGNLSRANVARKARERSDGGKPRATPRRALPDQFFDAAYDTAKKVESLHRLISDDRFPQNAEKVAAKHRNDLLRARDLLEQVITALPEQESTRD